MKKKLLKVLPAFAVATVMVLGVAASGCSKLDDKPLAGETYVDFTEGESDLFVASNGWSNGDPFNSLWSPDHANYTENGLKLTIADNPNGSAETYSEYYGGEVKSQASFGYGDFTVCMKPSNLSGTVSAFFTYTGPSDVDEDGNPHPWDEIDIEFTGNDTTRVQFNYYVDGVGQHEKWYDLGFDASEDFHEYGFRWTEDYIVWFVDGVPVYKVYGDEETPMPSTESHIIMNCWRGVDRLEGWMGEYVEPTDVGAEYKYVKTSATPVMPKPDDTPSTPDEVFEGDWSAIDPVEVAFASSNGKHEITADGTDYTVVYTDIVNTTADAYSNISGDITAAADGKNWAHFTLKNNATDGSTPIIRVDVIGTNADGETAKVLNTSANMNGTAVRTDLEWGGSFFENIPASEDLECEVSFEGVATQLLIMIDSTRQNDAASYSGNITIGDIKFAKQGEVVTPEEKPSLTINGAAVSIKGNLSDSEYVAEVGEENTLNVTYAAMSGSVYKNVELADVSSVLAENNTFTLKATNNGTQTVNLRVNIYCAKVANNDTCNLSATQDGEEVRTDLEWGGSFFTVEPGDTITAVVVYNTLRIGSISTIQFMIDSSVGDAAVRSGDITLSAMALSYDENVVLPEPEPTPEPDPSDATKLTFTSTDKYVVSNSGVASDSVTVTYENISGGTYANIAAPDAKDLAAGKDTFAITIKNNGSAAVTVRVDLIGEKTAPTGVNFDTNVTNVSSSCVGGSNSYTNVDYGGTYVTIAAGETATLTIVYDGEGPRGAVQKVQIYFDSATDGDTATYSGNVTLSGFAFSSSEEN